MIHGRDPPRNIPSNAGFALRPTPCPYWASTTVSIPWTRARRPARCPQALRTALHEIRIGTKQSRPGKEGHFLFSQPAFARSSVLPCCITRNNYSLKMLIFGMYKERRTLRSPENGWLLRIKMQDSGRLLLGDWPTMSRERDEYLYSITEIYIWKVSI